MDNSNTFPTKNRAVLISAVIMAILVTASLFSIFVYYFILQELMARAPRIDRYAKLFDLGYPVQLVLLISTAVTQILAFRHYPGLRKTGLVVAALGTLSFFSIIITLISFHELYNEYYLNGWESSPELAMIYTGLSLSLLFYLAGIYFLMKLFATIKQGARSQVSADSEIVFEITQYVGMLCGIIGTAFTLYVYLYLDDNSNRLTIKTIRWIYSCCLTFMVPYVAAAFYWVVKLVFKRSSGLYDEKQRHDLSVAGLITWLLSMPLLSVLLIISLSHSTPATGVMVFPFYLFATLIIFSATVLFNFKRG